MFSKYLRVFRLDWRKMQPPGGQRVHSTRAAHRTVTAYGRKGTVEDGYGITVPVTVP